MIRILRAFAWLRWRMFINSFEHTGTRDVLERFSLAVEQLGPVIAAILMIPSAIALAVLGVAAGLALAGGQPRPVLFELSRYLLLIITPLAVVGPLLLPAADRTNPVRLLLLPIPRTTLYVSQAGSAIGDPWIVLGIPLLVGIPLGLAIGGGLVAAAMSLVGGVLLLAAIVGLSSVATTLVHLALRDRKRGEFLALLFIVVLPLLAMLPGLLDGEERRARGEARQTSSDRPVPDWVVRGGRRAYNALPSELYVRSARAAAGDERAAAVAPLLALAGTVVFLHGVGFLAFTRVLDSPGTSSARRSTPMREVWGRTLPGLSPGASAVAFAHLRLALRTPRGRSIFLSPLMLLGIFAIVMLRNRQGLDLGAVTLDSGIGLAVFTASIAVITILPLAFNQFAIDGAGLTLTLLSPLSQREYLTGKAVGNALVVTPGMLLCVAGSYAIFPRGALALWVSIPLAMLSMYLLVSPVAAIFSAIFPRQVDMNSIGNKSNAHGLAGLLGLLAFVLAAVPAAVLTLVATRVLDRPSLTPVLLLAWCAVAFVIARVLFVPARRIFNERRENLGIVVGST